MDRRDPLDPVLTLHAGWEEIARAIAGIVSTDSRAAASTLTPPA